MGPRYTEIPSIQRAAPRASWFCVDDDGDETGAGGDEVERASCVGDEVEVGRVVAPTVSERIELIWNPWQAGTRRIVEITQSSLVAWPRQGSAMVSSSPDSPDLVIGRTNWLRRLEREEGDVA